MEKFPENMENSFDDSLRCFKEKFNKEETTFDSVDMEKYLREFKTELYIKRDQVKQLRNDLEIATNEINDFRKALDASTKILEEKTFNFNVLTKKFRTTEDELIEKINSLNTIQMQHQSTISELEKIKENLQKTEAEKLEITRKLEIFETKQRQNYIYHNHILKRETTLKKTIEEVQEMVKILKIEQYTLMDLSKQTKIAENSIEKLEQLSLKYKKLKKEKDYFEEMYIKINAKYEMLKELLNSNEDLQDPNLVNKFIFNQWKLNRSHYEIQLQGNNELLNKLSDCYNNEKMANVQLIQRNQQLTEANQNFETKIAELNQNHNDEVNNFKQRIMELEEKLMVAENNVEEMKTEPVEIED